MKKVLPFLRRLIYCSGSKAASESQRYKVTKRASGGSGLRVGQPREKRKKVLLDFLYLGKPCSKSKFLFPSLASS